MGAGEEGKGGAVSRDGSRDQQDVSRDQQFNARATEKGNHMGDVQPQNANLQFWNSNVVIAAWKRYNVPQAAFFQFGSFPIPLLVCLTT